MLSHSFSVIITHLSIQLTPILGSDHEEPTKAPTICFSVGSTELHLWQWNEIGIHC